MKYDRFHQFKPHHLLRSGHAQTLAGAFLPWRRTTYRAVQHRITLPDGDTLIIHDDCPATWEPGDRSVLLMHGLAGCHLSGYMIRVSSRLFERGIRTFRLDLRGSGAGAGLARRPYHAGCSDDVLHVIRFVQQLCPESSICPIGFSLSGNVLLKLLGEAPERVPEAVGRAMVLNPPIDLRGCVKELGRFVNRIYDRHFVSQLHRNLMARKRSLPGVEIPDPFQPKRLYDFDDQYTAPVAGFDSADDYYARCSAAQFLSGIIVPTLILTARDDPLVPVASFEQARCSDSVVVHVAEGGGHLGYVARSGSDPDRRWMDWRIVDWVTAPSSSIL